VDLSTTYLGFTLPHPLISGASPLADEVDGAARLEEAGAAMIVLRSMFEEQIAPARASSRFPSMDGFRFSPDSYLDHLARVKGAVGVPVAASMNGTTAGRWVNYARLVEQAGADALELNLFLVPTDPDENALDVERRLLSVVTAVRERVKLPLAVKLSPFHTSLPSFARQLASAGADGAVLFNRFYEPDIDIRNRQVVRALTLSSSTELLPRLHALATVSGRTPLALAVTGGVHAGLDALKAVMCGADAVQMVSALLRNGPEHLGRVRAQIEQVLEAGGWDTLAQIKGSTSLSRWPDPKDDERINYMHILQSWRA